MVYALTMMNSGSTKSTTSFRFTPECHTEHLLESIQEMRAQNILVDVVLIVEGREFPAHRNVLAASSDYFKAMFSSPFADSETSVKLEGLTAKAIELILDFMYIGEIEITEDNLEEILVASRLLLLESVTVACCKFTQDRINVNNCWGIRNIADKYSLKNLFGKVHAFIEDNFAEAKGSTEFLTLPFELMKELMSDDELNIREDELVSAVLKWVQHDLEGRYKYLNVLFKHLRLGYISEEYMRNLVEHNPLVSDNPFLVDLMKAARNHSDTLNDLVSQDELVKMSTPRKWQRIVPVLTAVGGTQTLFYNTEEKIWVSLAPITTRHCPGLASIGSQMFLVGGSREWVRLPVCERFSPEENTWEDMAPMHIARSNMGLVLLEGYLYSVGGYDGNTPSRYVERYDPKTNQWTFMASMNNLRDAACVVADNNNIFTIAGFDGNSYLNTMDVYDPGKNVWTTEGYSPIKNLRQDAMSAYVEGMIYIIGGYHNDNCMASGEVYDIEENEWTTIASMSVERNKAGCAALNRKIYICGGWEGSGNVLSSVEFYDTETDCWTLLPSMPTPSSNESNISVFPSQAS
ncbi:kelch-like protein 17 [Dendronephthya gigantea]|uniref:kelch-like protein 17 n=1 Tax=Dendronephthya gigantea TaxID=151771 RepID=UPI00106CF6C7|nr:kelch-like protein 17 [Dendronephthya gigantea]